MRKSEQIKTGYLIFGGSACGIGSLVLFWPWLFLVAFLLSMSFVLGAWWRDAMYEEMIKHEPERLLNIVESHHPWGA